MSQAPNEDLIPKNQVIDDMSDPNRDFVSSAARSYYYEKYATEEQRNHMDMEDKVNTIIAIIIWLFVLGATFVSLIMQFLNP